jgi:hypothetical protein
MAVQKFKSIAAMNAATPPERDEDAVASFLRHAARLRRLSRRTWRPGVQQFRSIQEAQRARQRAAPREP